MGLATRPTDSLSPTKPPAGSGRRRGAAGLFGTLLARTRRPFNREELMGSPHRQSGFTNFTLERPAAFVRRAQIVIVERTEPWFARLETMLLQVVSAFKHARTRMADASRRSLIHTQASWRESLPRIRHAQAKAVDAVARRAQSTRAAIAHHVGPRLAAAQTAVSHAALRGVMWIEDTRVRSVVPWLTRTQQNATVATIHALMWAQTTYDHRFVPWAIETRDDLRERFQSSDDVLAAVKARWEEGLRVPLWLVLTLMLVTALFTQAVAHQNGDRRSEVTSRQLAQVYKSEQEAAQVRARETLARESDDLHRMFGAVMVWTMQNALARKSYDELDQYLTEIGKSDRVKLALLADLNGKVVAATDQRLKGTLFAQHFPSTLLNEAVMTIQSDGDLKRLVLPIERYSVRLGTAVLVYAPPRLASNGP
jgi:hypothetical protein